MIRRAGFRKFSSLSLLLFSVVGVLAGVAARPAEEAWTVVLSGDSDGTLAPCGCTSPMVGGLKRRITAQRGSDHQVLIDNGSLSNGLGRQNLMKAETGAQALKLANIDAANFTARDAILGPGEALSLSNLSGGRFISTSLRPSSSVPFEAWREAGPFLIGGATARPAVLGQGLREEAIPSEEAAHRLAAEAEGRGLVPIMLFDGDRTAAVALARAEPALRLVTYRATGSVPLAVDRVGNCVLATPGEHGKGISRLVWRDGGFVSIAVTTLGPEIPDDSEAKQLYRTYLQRVTDGKLLEKVDRTPGNLYSGSAKCISCHAEAGKVWRASGHSHALATLEHVGNDRDPDCVSCHVVGLTKTTGFRSRTLTPDLANVGCESCHGAGAKHSASPWKVALPKLNQSACLPCHTLDNSPNFDFSVYWPKIKHAGKPRKSNRPTKHEF